MTSNLSCALWRTCLASLMLLSVLGMPAHAFAEESGSVDPYEKFNRTMFAVHEAIDGALTKPLAKGYDQVVPLPVKMSVGNAFGNIGDLWIGANSAMQGKFSEAGTDFGRLLINSTLGIFGLFDVASEMGIEKHDEDFGQTLGAWGYKDSAYVFLPVLGPKTVRDTLGFGVDTLIDPVSSTSPVSARNSLLALRVVDIRAGLLPSDKLIDEAALDKYAYIRDAYLQRRRNQVFDGRPPKLEE